MIECCFVPVNWGQEGWEHSNKLMKSSLNVMGKTLDHKIAGTFWSAPGHSKSFFRTYCPWGERLKIWLSLRVLRNGGLRAIIVKSVWWSVWLYHILFLKNLSDSVFLRMYEYCLQCHPGRGYITAYTGQWQISVLRLDGIAVCCAMLSGLEELYRYCNWSQNSCPSSSWLFCLWF